MSAATSIAGVAEPLRAALAALVLSVAAPGAAGDGGLLRAPGCLDPGAIADIREHPGKISRHYAACRGRLMQVLPDGPGGLAEAHREAAFAAVVAHRMAAYGRSSAFGLRALLHEPRLDCDNYAALTGYLIERLPAARAGALRFVGMDGGVLGNHAQVFYRYSGREVLLDPTVGVVARVSYADAFAGRPLDPSAIADFYHHADPAIASFKRRVIDALATGRYRPAERIYVARGLGNFLSFARACTRGAHGRQYLSYSASRLPELCRAAAQTVAASR